MSTVKCYHVKTGFNFLLYFYRVTVYHHLLVFLFYIAESINSHRNVSMCK